MCDFFDGVFEAVGPVVHGVDGPCCACAVVRCAYDAVHDRVAEVEVWACHVDFGSEDHGSVGHLARGHFLEEFE